jgi:hypothetical protein
MKRLLGLSIFALALLAVLGAGPAFADETAASTTAPAVAASPAAAQPGCGQTPDLAAVLSAKAEVCPAALPQSPQPELKLGRTCRCSCGYPCKTDADCGPGGICSGGISCC